MNESIVAAIFIAKLREGILNTLDERGFVTFGETLNHLDTEPRHLVNDLTTESIRTSTRVAVEFVDHLP